MNRIEFEEHFHKYRKNLRQEIHRFLDCSSILRQISENTVTYLHEMNFAPSFFQTVEAALFTTIVLWGDKLFDEHGQRGIFNFLTFIEHNRKWISVEELKLRRNYPNDHWMLEPSRRIPITFDSINTDRNKIKSLSVLKSLQIRRDKFHGHFDKDYFFDKSTFNDIAPITWNQLDEIGKILEDILNHYSVEFDGNSYSMSTSRDLANLLEITKLGVEANESRI
jgi:AbiU2